MGRRHYRSLGYAQGHRDGPGCRSACPYRSDQLRSFSHVGGRMSADWVTAIATAGTFVVIAASALAAVLQLRHTRGSNQIIALTECREKLESDEFQEARAFLSLQVPELMKDPAMERRLEQPY